MDFYDLQASKTPTNLPININLSAALEAAPAEKLKKIRREKWLLENADAIQSYNEFVEEQGLFGDDIRSF